MTERDDDERQAENQEAAAAAVGALLGSAAGSVGAIAGAWLGPKLKRWVRGIWAELSESARQRQTDVLFWAIREGVPVDEMEARIKASKRTELLTVMALDAAWQTVREDKLRTLGRSLAEGLLAEENAKIDTEQMIIAATTDIEGPQLAMLELLVAWRPGQHNAEPPISGPLDLPKDSHDRPFDDNWDVAWRRWSHGLIAHARPNLAPLAPSLLGTLQRHGLVVRNDNAGETIERLQGAVESAFGQMYEHVRAGGGYSPQGAPRLSTHGVAQEPSWSPTELGEQVFLRFRDAGMDLDDVWSSGPPGQ